jgi:hypothetical protein
MAAMDGHCHCGAVRIEVARAPAEVASCNCSLCRRVGGLWAYYHPDEVRVEAAEGATEPYVQGDRSLATHHCRTCGCITHWQSLMPDLQRMGVNARLLDGLDPARVPVRLIDGASF